MTSKLHLRLNYCFPGGLAHSVHFSLLNLICPLTVSFALCCTASTYLQELSFHLPMTCLSPKLVLSTCWTCTHIIITQQVQCHWLLIWFLHCKKGYRFSRPQPGCHLSNSAWPGIIKRVRLVTSRLGTGKTITFFNSVCSPTQLSSG